MFTMKDYYGNERNLYTLRIGYTRGGRWYYLEKVFIGLSGLHIAMNIVDDVIHDHDNLMEKGYIHSIEVRETYVSGYSREY